MSSTIRPTYKRSLRYKREELRRLEAIEREADALRDKGVERTPEERRRMLALEAKAEAIRGRLLGIGIDCYVHSISIHR